VNVQVLSKNFLEGKECTLLLENPLGSKYDAKSVLCQLEALLNLRGMDYYVYTDSDLSVKLTDSAKLSSGQMLYVKVEGSSSGEMEENSEYPSCNFVNVAFGKRKGTLLLENPKGRWVDKKSLPVFVQHLFDLNSAPFLRVKSEIQGGNEPGLDNIALTDLCGKTLYV